MKPLRALGLGFLIFGVLWLYAANRTGVVYPGMHHNAVTLVQAAPQSIFTSEEQRGIDIYKRVSPSVVNITSQLMQWDMLFGPVPASGQGSGFVIDKNGYILTNNHVIEGARKLTVTWTPQRDHSRTYTASVVGHAPQLDLAVIKVEGGGLPAATLGDSSNLQVGQEVYAIGNPFGLPGTMTRGIISSIRTMEEGDQNVDIENAIQTDAPINPGNSGGPLLNSAGEVVGIDTMIYSETGSNVGIGFAIPINVAKTIMNQMLSTGTVQAVSLGIQTLSLSPDISQQLGLTVDHGLLVSSVRPGSLGERAGLKGGDQPGYLGNTRVMFGGDIILAFNGEPVRDQAQLSNLLLMTKPGAKVTLTVQRGARQVTLTLQLESGAPM